MNKLIKYAVVISMLAVMAVPSLALAQEGSCNSWLCKLISVNGIMDLISKIEGLLLGVGVALATIFIIWGGIMYMYAGDNEDATTKAKDRIKNGVIGAAVVIGVSLILQLISKILYTPSL